MYAYTTHEPYIYVYMLAWICAHTVCMCKIDTYIYAYTRRFGKCMHTYMNICVTITRYTYNIQTHTHTYIRHTHRTCDVCSCVFCVYICKNHIQTHTQIRHTHNPQIFFACSCACYMCTYARTTHHEHFEEVNQIHRVCMHTHRHNLLTQKNQFTE